MTDDRPTTDGGETAAPLDVRRAGDSPPDPPSPAGIERELEDLLADVETVANAYLVRAGLASGSDRSVGERLVGALEDKVTVVGSTLDAGLDPGTPELDVLIETDHDHGAIASTLASVEPVDGVVVADVTDAAERELTGATDDVNAASANDVFNELKKEVGQEGYGTVVEELEDVSFPGGHDPDDEIDLEAEVGVDLTSDEGTLDLDDGGTIDLDGDEELTTGQLLGEDDRDGATEVKSPDEKAIEQAIEEVELNTGADEQSADDDGVESPDGPAASVDSPEEPARPVDSPEAPGKPVDSPEEPGKPAESSGERATPADSSDGPDASPGTSEEDSPAPEASPDSAFEPVDEGDALGGGAARAGGARGDVGDVDAFVDAFVEALESGTVDEDQRAALREALGIESNHSLDVRLEYLQKRVDNLAAYTDAWEAFLVEEGSGREFMASVEEEIATVEERIEAVEAAGGGADGDVGAVAGEIEALEARLADLSGRHDDDVSRLDTRMDSVESKLVQRVDGVEDALGTLKEKVSALLQWREHVDDVLGDDGG